MQGGLNVASRFLFFGLLIALLMLTACNPAGSEASPTARGAFVPTRMATESASSTPTITPSPTATFTLTPTLTPTLTLTSTATLTPVATSTSTMTPSATPTATFTLSPTPELPQGAEYDPASNILLLPVAFGQLISGVINNENFFASYLLEANSSDSVTIEMRTTSGDLDPYLVLVHRATRQVVAENDDGTPSSLDARLDRIVLTEGGTYIILATRFAGQSGSTSGEFSLQVIRN